MDHGHDIVCKDNPHQSFRSSPSTPRSSRRTGRRARSSASRRWQPQRRRSGTRLHREASGWAATSIQQEQMTSKWLPPGYPGRAPSSASHSLCEGRCRSSKNRALLECPVRTALSGQKLLNIQSCKVFWHHFTPQQTCFDGRE
jgi:hypothetical protein